MKTRTGKQPTRLFYTLTGQGGAAIRMHLFIMYRKYRDEEMLGKVVIADTDAKAYGDSPYFPQYPLGENNKCFYALNARERDGIAINQSQYSRLINDLTLPTGMFPADGEGQGWEHRGAKASFFYHHKKVEDSLDWLLYETEHIGDKEVGLPDNKIELCCYFSLSGSNSANAKELTTEILRRTKFVSKDVRIVMLAPDVFRDVNNLKNREVNAVSVASDMEALMYHHQGRDTIVVIVEWRRDDFRNKGLSNFASVPYLAHLEELITSSGLSRVLSRDLPTIKSASVARTDEFGVPCVYAAEGGAGEHSNISRAADAINHKVAVITFEDIIGDKNDPMRSHRTDQDMLSDVLLSQADIDQRLESAGLTIRLPAPAGINTRMRRDGDFEYAVGNFERECERTIDSVHKYTAGGPQAEKELNQKVIEPFKTDLRHSLDQMTRGKNLYWGLKALKTVYDLICPTGLLNDQFGTTATTDPDEKLAKTANATVQSLPETFWQRVFFGPPKKKQLARHDLTLKTTDFKQSCLDQVKARIVVKLFEVARPIIEEQIKILDRVLGSLEMLKDRAETRLEGAKKVPDIPFVFELITPELLDKILEDQVLADRASAIRQLCYTTKLVEELGVADSQTRTAAIDEFDTDLMKIIHRESIIDHFREKLDFETLFDSAYPSQSDKEEKIKVLLGFGKPNASLKGKIELPNTVGEPKVIDVTEFAYCYAVVPVADETQSPSDTYLGKLVTRVAQSLHDRFADRIELVAGDQDGVFIFSRVGALPLCAFTLFDEMKDVNRDDVANIRWKSQALWWTPSERLEMALGNLNDDDVIDLGRFHDVVAKSNNSVTMIVNGQTVDLGPDWKTAIPTLKNGLLKQVRIQVKEADQKARYAPPNDLKTLERRREDYCKELLDEGREPTEVAVLRQQLEHRYFLRFE